jgi:hypothetical protein
VEWSRRSATRSFAEQAAKKAVPFVERHGIAINGMGDHRSCARYIGCTQAAAEW